MGPVTLDFSQLLQLGTTVATVVLSFAAARYTASQALRDASEAIRIAHAAHARLDKHRSEQQALQLILQDLKTRIELMPATTAATVLEKLVSAGVYGKRAEEN